jgi:uncharacterized UBP type Zn finger protein
MNFSTIYNSPIFIIHVQKTKKDSNQENFSKTVEISMEWMNEDVEKKFRVPQIFFVNTKYSSPSIWFFKSCHKFLKS